MYVQWYKIDLLQNEWKRKAWRRKGADGDLKHPVWSVKHGRGNFSHPISKRQSIVLQLLYTKLKAERPTDEQQLKVAVVKAQQSSARGEPAFCDAHGF